MWRLAGIPVLVGYVPDHDGGPRVPLRSRRRLRVGVAGGLGILEQEARLPAALSSFPVPAATASTTAAAAPGTFLGLLPGRCRGRRGRRRRRRRRHVLAALALALLSRAGIASLGLIARPPQKHHSFPGPYGDGRRRGGCRRLRRRRLGRSPRRLLKPRWSRRGGPVVGRVPAPRTDRHTAKIQPPTG